MLVAYPGLALAHSQTGRGTGFLTGVIHPFTGLDHVLAMLAVGMWGAQLRGNAIWILPVAFPLMMALGGVAGILGVPMLPIEPGVAASVIALGSAIAANFRPPLAGAAALVGVFAIFHGYAHGMELPRRADALPYCVGFVMATGLIHLAGIALGLLAHRPRGAAVLRLGGASIAIVGLVLAVRLLR
jgi:urease accessory protein